jgi:hypothetical protein
MGSVCAFGSILTVAGGCAAPPRGFDSPDPGARLDAITDAAAVKDRSAVGPLIESLDSDDPAVRLASILALERITGQSLGYDYAAPSWRRSEQAARWAAWYRETGGRTSGASAVPGSG